MLVFRLGLLHAIVHSSFLKINKQSELLDLVLQGLRLAHLLQFQSLLGFTLLPFQLGELALLTQLQPVRDVLLLLVSLL